MLRRYLAKPALTVVAITAVAVLASLLYGQDARAATGNIRVDPATQTVPALATNFTVTLIQNADVATTGAQATFTFDKNMYQIQSIVTGPLYGSDTPTTANTITDANTTSGQLRGIVDFVTPPTTIPSGDQTFVIITLQNRTCGKTNFTLSDLSLIDSGGVEFTPTGTNGNAVSVNAIDFNPLGGDGIQDWTTPFNDSDCDGYPNSVAGGPPPTQLRGGESQLGDVVGGPGTLANQRCPANTGANNEEPDAWPPDNNDNQLVNGQDFLRYNTVLGQSVGSDPVKDRLDLNQSGGITGADVLQLNAFFGKRCV